MENTGGEGAAEVFLPGVMVGDVNDGVNRGALGVVTLVLVVLLVTGVVSSHLGLLIGVVSVSLPATETTLAATCLKKKIK